MTAAYGVNVADPALTARRLWSLLHHLPPGSRRAGEQWSTESHMLAALIDYVAYLTWVTLRAHGAKSAPRPRELPRPPRRGVAAAPPPVAGGNLGDGRPHATSGWADAAKVLSGVEGVIVHVRDG